MISIPIIIPCIWMGALAGGVTPPSAQNYSDTFIDGSPNFYTDTFVDGTPLRYRSGF